MSRKELSVAARPITRLVSPFQRFARIESAGGIVLLAASIAAIVWANSPAAESYASLLHIPITLGFGAFRIAESLHVWINDGLMAVFFLFVGLEIKHEMFVGELSSLRLSALPVLAAAGGVVVPAGIYFALNHGHPTAGGWGIPMATDIAFALGILSLSGSRAPTGLKVFLTALAIVDDIAAVLVIAFFYSSRIDWTMLLAAFVLLGVGALLNRLGVTQLGIYLAVGFGVWVCMLRSGVHATIAGVLVALIIPSSRYLEPREFLRRARREITSMEEAYAAHPGRVSNETRDAFLSLQTQSHLVQAPLLRLEHALQPWVSFCIMPLFALTNAGVPLHGFHADSLHDPAVQGIFFGLLLGKPIGILLFSWLAVRLGIVALPASVTWRHMIAAGCLGGIGFTMSLFISALAFGSGPEDTLAKVGILAASALAAVVGSLILLGSPRAQQA
jgi:NhaA family Na+:H+ antiporter